MVARVRSTRAADKPKGKPRGRNGGRKKGVLNKFNERAIRQARASGNRLPHELLLEWANTGLMHDGHKKKVELDVAQRIQCTVAAAPYYGQKLAPKQVGDQPNVTRLELDVAALKGLPLDQLQLFREVLLMLSRGGLSGAHELATPQRADPSVYARTLRPDSETQGRA